MVVFTADIRHSLNYGYVWLILQHQSLASFVLFQNLSGDLVSRESLVEELKAVAEPLSSSCAPEVSEHVQAAVKEAVTAWENTCTEVRELCTKYHNAVDLWKQYREASDLVHEWCDQMEDVANLPPEDTGKSVQVGLLHY